jgi:tetratricopeptide (TPR) repeat protein
MRTITLVLIIISSWCNSSMSWAQQDWTLYYNRGLDFYNHGEFTTALEELNLAIQSNPSYAQAYALRGKIKVLLMQNESATRDYQKAFELNAEYFNANQGKAPLNALLEDYKGTINRYTYGAYRKSSQDSILQWSESLSNTDSTIIFLEQVHQKIEKGLRREAERNLLDFVRKDKTNTYAYYLLGCIKEFEHDYPLALSYYEQNIRIDPSFYLHYYKRALVLHKLERNDEALADWAMVEKLNKEFELLYFNRAVLYKKQKRWQLALEDLNHVLVLNKDFAEGYFNRAYVKKELADYRGAKDDYTTYLNFRPEDAMAYNNRANVSLQLGDYSSAQKDYNQAVVYSPQLSMAYLNRGIGNIMLGNKDEACHDFNTSFMMGNAKAKKKLEMYCY